MEKIFFVSLGCDKNLVDSEIIIGILGEEGYTITNVEEEADIMIINTCGFIEAAVQESIDNIITLGEYKKAGKCKGLIVAGCLAQRYSEDIFEQLPEVDGIVGTGDYENICKVIRNVIGGEKVKEISDKNRTLDEVYSRTRVLTTPGYYAYLKIAEGCDNKCTYCTIPSIRGKYRSRSIEKIVEEAKMLVEKGVKEIILVAQDTALYGKDLYGKSKIHLLLKDLAEIEELEWIRIMYAYPEHITDEFIEEMAVNKKVCKYLDMPIQHSNDKILKRMGRRSTENELRTLIAKLREKISGISLRTTLIVGFPDEGEEEFESLFTFIKDIKFDHLGVFVYSKEEGTPAYSMKNQVDIDIAIERQESIMSIQQEISREKLEENVGETLKVIIDGKLSDVDEEDMEGNKEVYCGRSYKDAYEVDGMVFFPYGEELIAGDFVNVKIEKISDYDMYGEIVD